MLDFSEFKKSMRWDSPAVQNMFISFILFCTPGFYQAIAGLGAGGGKASSTRVSDFSNSALYAVWTIFSWFGGSILNTLGLRWTLMIGSLGYSIYSGSFWYYDRTGHQWFPILAGVILGFTATLVWTAQGFAVMSYPEERHKGRYIAIGLSIVNFGSVVGAIIALGLQIKDPSIDGVPTRVYLAFVIIMAVAVLFAFFVYDPKKIKRNDGTPIALFPPPDWRYELKGIVEILKDKRIWMLMPCLFCSEMEFSMMSSVNAYYYNTRTRSLNVVIFWLIQIPTTVLLSFFVLDNERLGKRKRRAFIAIGVVSAVTEATYIGQIVWVQRHNLDRSITGPGVDWTDGAAFGGSFTLFLFFGIVNTAFVTLTMWMLASLSNDPRKLARYASLFKGVQSAGDAVAFGYDSVLTSFLKEWIVCFVLMTYSFFAFAIVAWKWVDDTNYFKEDNVVPPHHVEDEMGLRYEKNIEVDIEEETVVVSE